MKSTNKLLQTVDVNELPAGVLSFSMICVPFLRTSRVKKCVPLSSKSAYPRRGTQNFIIVRVLKVRVFRRQIKHCRVLAKEKPCKRCPARFLVVTVGLEPTSVRSIVVQTPWSGVCTRFALTNSRRFLLRRTAHRADASLVCPIDVNDVLYRLSHATTFRTLGLPVQLDIWNSSSYRLSHATTSAYLRHTSPVGHLVQFVLPTEPCDHEHSYKDNGWL